MNILTLIVAAILLFFGRELYWLLVGAVGFLLGMQYGSLWFAGQPEYIILLAAVGIGLLGALLAIALQRVALALAGFFGGGYFALQLAQNLGAGSDFAGMFAFVLGGIIMAVLVLMFLDPALIALSALTGAAVIAQALPVETVWRGVAFIVLLILGIAAQAGLYYRRRRLPPAVS